MNSVPRILLCWSGHPGYGPPPVLSTNQVVIYSHHDRKVPGLIDPPRLLADRQDYDLKAAVEKFGSVDEFDLICVCCAASDANKLLNVAAFKCPKVLLVTDTHHLKANPIHFVLDYQEIENFDCITALFNRDHMRWFGHLKNVRRGWFPGLTIEDIRPEISAQRKNLIGFVGHWQRNHPRRQNFIAKIQRDGLPFEAQTLSRAKSAEFFAERQISFNCSLNGDLNMRVYEILSAGGFLLTDRLSSYAGLDEILEDGKDYVSYTSYADFRTKAEYYLDNPEEALAIASHGHQTYKNSLATGLMAQRFFEWVLNGKHSECDYTDNLTDIPGAAFSDRLSCYERIQRLQLFQEKVKVLAIGQKATAALNDLRDLARVERYAFNGGLQSSTTNIKYCNQTEVNGTNWSAILVDYDLAASLPDFGVTSDVILNL